MQNQKLRDDKLQTYPKWKFYANFVDESHESQLSAGSKNLYWASAKMLK